MLPYRRLGQTDLSLSTLGLGTVKFGRTQSLKYPQAFSLPDNAQVRELLNCCRDLGINLLDTAPAYGYSEERIGELLGKTRKEWIISTKVGEEFEADPFSNNGRSWFDFSAKHTRMSVERSLRRLRTDYLDLVLIHAHGNDEQLLRETEVVHTLAQLKREGWIRAFGASTKTLAGGLLAAELCDAVMVSFSLNYRDEEAVIDACHEKNKGVLLKKVLASGHICHDSPPKNQQDLLEQTLDTALNKPGVTSAIIGTINPSHLRTNGLSALQVMQ